MKCALPALLAFVLAAACRHAEQPHENLPASSRAGVSSMASPTGTCAAQAELAQLDTRSPVPLPPVMANHQKQNMREHLMAVQEIAKAAAAEDFAVVERAAGRIGYSEQVGQMCSHMGARAPGFTQRALTFHHAADTIGAAARQHDNRAILLALGATLQTCTECHAVFRQEVVEPSE
jgi:hypothetical protein